MTIRLREGETALVGYGSLLSKPSLERTLGRSYNGPFVPCSVRGWRRTWDAAMPNAIFYAETKEGRIVPETILYLNVRQDPATDLPAVLFVVGEADLEAYDQRESIYTRVDVTGDLDVQIEGGAAYIYVCRPEHCLDNVVSPERGAIRASYLRIVEDGLAGFSENFRSRYLASTDVPPAHLIINDALSEPRP